MGFQNTSGGAHVPVDKKQRAIPGSTRVSPVLKEGLPCQLESQRYFKPPLIDIRNGACSSASDVEDDFEGRDQGPQPIGEILARLLGQYEARFPEVRIVAVKTPVAAA